MTKREENVSFDNGAGVRLAGVLVMPRKDAPIVILCHGLASGKDSRKHLVLAPALAAEGIGSLRFDFFGHGESGGDFADLTLDEGVEDVKRAHAYLRKRFPRSRIGLLGGSFGGGAVFYAMPSLDVAGAALVCPAILRISFNPLQVFAWRLLGRAPYRSYSTKRLHMLKYEFYASFAAKDGLKAAEGIAPSVLILHGDADEKVPYAQSEEIVRRLRHGRLSTYAGVDHFFRGEPQQRMVEEAVGFFKGIFALDRRPQAIKGKARA